MVRAAKRIVIRAIALLSTLSAWLQGLLVKKHRQAKTLWSLPPLTKIRRSSHDDDVSTEETLRPATCWSILQRHYNETELLRRLKLGDFIGKGTFTQTYEAYFDQPLDDALDSKTIQQCFVGGTQQRPTFVAKITGNFKDKHNQLHLMKDALFATEIVERLSPHPSIPIVLYHFSDISNPFRIVEGKDKLISASKGRFLNRSKPSVRKDGKDNKHISASSSFFNSGNSTELPEYFDKVLKEERISLTLAERVEETHFILDDDTIKVYGEDTYYPIIPKSKLRCFWRKLFEILDYMHMKNVIMGDLELWNVILQNGVIKFFDLNRAKIFEPNATSPNARLYGHVSPKLIQSEECYYLRYAFRAYLKVQERLREAGKEYLPKNSTDYQLLEDVQSKLAKKRSCPTMRWFLDNHEYFKMGQDENCTLVW